MSPIFGRDVRGPVLLLYKYTSGPRTAKYLYLSLNVTELDDSISDRLTGVAAMDLQIIQYLILVSKKTTKQVGRATQIKRALERIDNGWCANDCEQTTKDNGIDAADNERERKKRMCYAIHRVSNDTLMLRGQTCKK